jgi:hypothetical protein
VAVDGSSFDNKNLFPLLGGLSALLGVAWQVVNFILTNRKQEKNRREERKEHDEQKRHEALDEHSDRTIDGTFKLVTSLQDMVKWQAGQIEYWQEKFEACNRDLNQARAELYRANKQS